MRRRRILIALGVLVALAAGAVAFVLINKPGNVSNPDVAFEDETATPTPTPTPLGKKTGRPKPEPAFIWPMYGFGPDRRRQVDVPDDFRPPFKRLWHYSAGVLIECAAGRKSPRHTGRVVRLKVSGCRFVPSAH